MAEENKGDQKPPEPPQEEQSEEMTHYRHPDGHWEEMTKSQAAKLAAKDGKKSEEDWKSQIKTRGPK